MKHPNDMTPSEYMEHMVRHALWCYSLDDNPQHLWRAWLLCRKHGIEVPETVLQYFDGVAEKLDPTSLEYLLRDENGRLARPTRIEGWARKALFSDVKPTEPVDTWMFGQCIAMAADMAPDLDLTEAQRNDLGMEFGVDERTIARWLNKYKEAIEIS